MPDLTPFEKWVKDNWLAQNPKEQAQRDYERREHRRGLIEQGRRIYREPEADNQPPFSQLISTSLQAPAWSVKQWDYQQQTRGMLLYLEKKINEHLDKSIKKKQPKEHKGIEVWKPKFKRT